MPEADYRLMTEATGQRIAAALEALSGTGAAAAAARTNLDVYSTSEVDAAIQQSTAKAVKHVGKTVTIPNGASQMQQVQIDFSDLLPSGVEAILLSATIGDYALPYCDDTGAVKTWIYQWGRYSHILTVKNLTTVWNNIYTNLEVDIRQ